jgi:hypothetical protein
MLKRIAIVSVSTLLLATAIPAYADMERHDIRKDKVELREDIHKRDHDRHELAEAKKAGDFTAVRRIKAELHRDNQRIKMDKLHLQRDEHEMHDHERH